MRDTSLPNLTVIGPTVADIILFAEQMGIRAAERLKIKSICNKKHRNIYKTTYCQMYIWAHYKFHELLKYKTSLRGGKVVECTEDYTSKTCS
jgi:transposase